MSTPKAPTGFTVGVPRPAYNTGVGFFVLNGKLYDANGNEFRIRGVNRAHYDSWRSPASIVNAKANTVRLFLYQLSVGAAKYASVLQTDHIANKEVAIATMAYFPDGSGTSGKTDPVEFAVGVQWWVANAAVFKPLERALIVNLANEWGPANSTIWRDSNISAVAAMRAADYLGTLMIDTGGWGQNIDDLLNYSAAVFNSDPQKNLIFSWHIYGAVPTANVASDIAKLGALSKSVGMAFVIGEFGPGNNVGPSPTLTTPAQIITAAEANGFGWVAWAWDDGAPFNLCVVQGQYSGAVSDLTPYGQTVVLNPTWGLKALAKPATIF